MTYPQKIFALCYNDLMNDEPDIAIAAAAKVCRMNTNSVRAATVEHEQGFRHLPGTPYHMAVVAWQAARLALEMERERV